jgi:Protein of unknown function (DUF3489)
MEGNMPIPKLTDTQLIILASASQREDGLAVMPEKLKGGAAKAVVTKLLDRALLKELRVKRGEPHWRLDEEERPLGLKLTRAGQRAIQVEEGAEAEEAPAAKSAKRAAKEPAEGRKDKGSTEAGPREGTKKALVLSLLSRPEGATIDDLLSATGWLPHTTRAALTGLRKEGYEFVKSKNAEGETVYRTEKHGQARGTKDAG